MGMDASTSLTLFALDARDEPDDLLDHPPLDGRGLRMR
jgi:hypothetical protein